MMPLLVRRLFVGLENCVDDRLNGLSTDGGRVQPRIRAESGGAYTDIAPEAFEAANGR